MALTDEQIIDRVVVRPDGCWGYSQQSMTHYPVLRGRENGHRAVHEILRGPIRDEAHHSCEVPGCVNPWHVEDVTRGEHRNLHPSNLQSAWERNRLSATCSRGHPWGPIPEGGRRHCRECWNAAQRRRRAA